MALKYALFDYIDPENNYIVTGRNVGLKLFSRKLSVSLHQKGLQLSYHLFYINLNVFV